MKRYYLNSVPCLLSLFLMAVLSLACQQQKNIPSDQRECICIEIYAPVCGDDQKTYPNSCHAGCAGVSDFTDGECEKL